MNETPGPYHPIAQFDRGRLDGSSACVHPSPTGLLQRYALLVDEKLTFK